MDEQSTVCRYSEVTKNTLVPVVGTFQHSKKSQISAKHHSLRPSIRAWETIAHNATVRETDREREREREREKKHWLSCDHVTFRVTYYSYCETLFVSQVEIY